MKLRFSLLDRTIVERTGHSDVYQLAQNMALCAVFNCCTSCEAKYFSGDVIESTDALT